MLETFLLCIDSIRNEQSVLLLDYVQNNESNVFGIAEGVSAGSLLWICIIQ
jgi:hypothetical protein